MQNDEIIFSELEIVSKSGEFYYLIGYDNTRVLKTTEDTFKSMLVATAKAYKKALDTYGEGSIMTDKAHRTYKFYENQIDITKGDMFTALLYPFDKWIAIK